MKNTGIFSTGEQYFKEMLNFSDTHSPNSLETNLALQARLGNYWKNNPAQVLEFSKQYSGETNENGKVPLGGAIDYNMTNAVNRQDSKFNSDEFDFWNFDKTTKKVSIQNTPTSNTNTNTKTKTNTNSKNKIESFGTYGSSSEESSKELNTDTGDITVLVIFIVIIFFSIFIIFFILKTIFSGFTRMFKNS